MIRGDSILATAGSSSTLSVNGSPDNSALLKWDIATIPAGSVVQSVSIQLQVTNGSTQSYELYEMKRNWVEANASWVYYASGKIWTGLGAQASADRGTTALGSLTNTGTGVVTVNLNSAGVALVQKWVNDPSTNFGFVMQDYASSSDNASFNSREAGAAATRPLFSIKYATGSALAALASASAAPLSTQAASSVATSAAAATGSTIVQTSTAAMIPGTNIEAARLVNSIALSSKAKPNSAIPVSVYDVIYRSLGQSAAEL